MTTFGVKKVVTARLLELRSADIRHEEIEQLSVFATGATGGLNSEKYDQVYFKDDGHSSITHWGKFQSRYVFV